MSESPISTHGALNAQPPMPVRRLHNYLYCPRLFYLQWVENIFEENADTAAGSAVHRQADQPSRLDDAKATALREPGPWFRLTATACPPRSDFRKREAEST